ncbi:RNA polymerase sigma-70 factor (sigma-E family) [Catenulispora sp. GAS73]|uniref:SigE family RNA polymerase sigma factor n=1 Tax=Catenulispora sp. GAS73 TaxID=3156269 RepID=UPI003513E979
MRHEDESEFRQYATDRSHALRRTAYLMCGDWHQAEDLVQTTLLKLYRSWRKVQRLDNRDAYVRKVLVRALIDERRRGWLRERPFGTFPDDVAAVESEVGVGVETRDEMLAALARIPARQRATLVLRFWEDQSVEQAAHVLGCSEGTVKSQTARGLAALRVALEGVRQLSAD